MPLLITALLIALTVFYFKGEPPAGEKVATASTNSPAPESTEVPPLIPAGQVLPPRETGSVETAGFAPSATPRGLPLLAHTEVSEADFTPWLSPLAFDTYLRQKNRGFKVSFWARGHWIEAIEGRWSEGRHEFRIAFDVIPDRERFQWYYRIDQTEEEFSDTLRRLRHEGYSLVQSQAYERPDKSKRYQAVWQREIPGGMTTESPGLLGSAPGLRPLEVGSLHIQ